MECPKCKTEMIVKKYKEVSIDKCPKCNAVVLDGGELEKIENAVKSESDDFSSGFILGGLLF